MKSIKGKVFGIVIGMACISILAIIILTMNLNNIREATNQMITVELLDYEELSNIAMDFEQIHKALLKHVMTTNENKQLIAENEIAAKRKSIEQTLLSYNTRITMEKEEYYQELTYAYAEYLSDLETILTMSNKGEKEKAQTLIFSNISNCETRVETRLSNLQDLSLQSMELEINNVKRFTSQAPYVVAIGIALMVIAVMIVYIATNKLIVIPIKKSTEKVEEMILYF